MEELPGSIFKTRQISLLDERYKLFAVFVVLLLVFLFFISPPRDFPEGVIFEVKEGTTLRENSFELKEMNLVRSRIVFEALAILYGGEDHIISADYLFEGKISSLEIARRMSKGERHLAPVKITIPEGMTYTEIGKLSALRLKNFNEEKFIALARNKEGYLFPDTYFFLTTANEKNVLDSLVKNFEEKISPLQSEISASGRTEEEIIKMASIIEKESKGDADREMVSGILWKRFRIGMPLQADAAPETYQKKGLPGVPICNPGLLSIKAALYPKNSPYLYYIHDKEGNIHYAKNFTEHRQNINKYLK